MKAPSPRLYAWVYAIGALAIAFIALYRAGLYLFPPAAWALSLALVCLGMTAPLMSVGVLRDTLLTGGRPVILVAPFVGILVTPRLLPSPLAVAPFLFCAGALWATWIVALCNARHRRRLLGKALGQQALGSVLQDLQPPGDARPLGRALRAQAWLPTQSRRARAAAALRNAAAAIEQHSPLEDSFRRAGLREVVDARADARESVRAAYLAAASKLENGDWIFRWRRWWWSVAAAAVDAERDWFVAVDLLAQRQHVPLPTWFRGARRALARAPLTTRDVSPSWTIASAAGKWLAVGVGALLVATSVLSTATAQTPLDDARPLPVLAGVQARSHVEPRLSRALSVLAGHPAQARCWSQDDWQRLSKQRHAWPRHDRRLGRWSAYASVDGKRAHFSPTLCAWLSRLVYQRVPARDDVWPAALAYSVATLAHEAQHLRRVFNEAKAECYGMQSIPEATLALGRSNAEGRYLAAIYWRYQYHRHNSTYVSDECRNGGRLDLRPGVNVWP